MNTLSLSIFDTYLEPNEQVDLFEIATLMKRSNLPDEFIAAAIRTALAFEGVADLVHMWAEETDPLERDEIIADIQELIHDCQQQGKQECVYIRFNDLESIAKDVRAFKDSLLELVMKQGGISHLSTLTHIPQPSLSRFFNSNAMPQRTTLFKIAKALNLAAVKIAHQWA